MADINSNEKSKALWDEIAEDWDIKMGEHDNRYHREIIRPVTLKLLDPTKGDFILDAACGNGNFSRFMAKMGVKVTAFDYSPKMIAYAKERCRDWLGSIDFHVADATKYDELMKLKSEKLFDKAVSNMAIMDISDIEPLLMAVYALLKTGGIFVFSSIHPCFQTPDMLKFTEINDYTGESFVRSGIKTYEYITPKTHIVTALARNGKQVLHYHRPLNVILNMCFKTGFILDGIEEPIFKKSDGDAGFEWFEIPPCVIFRLRKL